MKYPAPCMNAILFLTLLSQPLSNKKTFDGFHISDSHVKMDPHVHIDRATLPFPDPPSTNIDKRSSLLTHPKRHLGSTQLQPRNAGFNYKNERLDEILESRRLSKQICKELMKGPPNATQDEKFPSKRRKHSIKTVFISRSKRKSPKENNKMPVATHRTSDGRKYGQILSEQIYDNGSNGSTYQVNRCRRPLVLPINETQQKQAAASFDIVSNITSTSYDVNGTKQQPASERSARSSVEYGEGTHRLSPYQTTGILNPTSGSLENRFLADRLVEENTAAGQNEGTTASLTKRSTADDSLGLLRDLSQILSRGETASLTTGTSQVPVPEAEHQPRVRDFAANGSAPFSRTSAAMQRRSRSPANRVGEQTDGPVTPDRSLDAATCGGQPATRLCRSPNSIILPPMAFQDPARPLEPLSPMTQEQVPSKASPVINYHSKAPSVVSAESTAEDIQSDASSGIVSNAQSAVFLKVPPQPGPAPLTPLPSLPEGFDNFAPATPRPRQSGRRLASPESSPSKISPQKSPARSQYKLYPSVSSILPKRSGSPTMMNAAPEPERVMPRLSPPLRSKRRGFSFPRSECLPTSMSVSRLEELEQWNKERADNTRQRKLRDLARVRSHKAMIAEVESVTRGTENGVIYDQGVPTLPFPVDSYSPATSPFKHRKQASQVSDLSTSTTLRYRGSTKLSQRLSPIIVVAEQEPTSRSQQAPFPDPRFSRDSIHKQTLLPRPKLQRPSDNSKARPLSSHSLPVPRPVASQATTPHLSPFLQGSSHHSLHPPSMHEVSGLEARLSAMERKNAMLERAFLAVLDTSAAFDSSLGQNGMEGACGNTSSDLSDRDGDQLGGTSGTGTLNAGLEKLLALHSGSVSSRWSTSNGP